MPIPSAFVCRKGIGLVGSPNSPTLTPAVLCPRFNRAKSSGGMLGTGGMGGPPVGIVGRGLRLVLVDDAGEASSSARWGADIVVSLDIIEAA